MKLLKTSLTLTLTLIVFMNFTSAQDYRLYDIYMTNVKTGQVQQITSIPDAGEFNASFSNNGKKIVCDVVTDGSHDLFITDVNTGVSSPLAGGDGGNDASWSPNGNLIAFDRVPYGDPAIYTVPAAGGDRTMIVGYGIDPEWAPNSQRIVFSDFNGAIRTIGIDGTGETLIFPYGAQSPNWSPNGQYITFSLFGHIVKIPVDIHGNVTGDIELVFLSPADVFSGGPTWSNNSHEIAFFSNLTGDFDIWSIGADGSDLEVIADQGGFNDYDPSFSKNGKYVAYSGVAAMIPGLQAPISNVSIGEVSEMIELKQNYPNPFEGSTTVDFELNKEQSLQIFIFDAKGQLVRTLANGVYDKGSHQLTWDGLSNDGKMIPDGIYICQMVTPEGIRNIQMIRMGK